MQKIKKYGGGGDDFKKPQQPTQKKPKHITLQVEELPIVCAFPSTMYAVVSKLSELLYCDICYVYCLLQPRK